MTKQQAIQAMQEGKKITHICFQPNEWMTMKNNQIVLEDGYCCDEYEFWLYRKQEIWNDGYSIYEE